MSIYTHPKIAASRAVEERERKIRVAKAILNETPGTIPASGRGRKSWARKTLAAEAMRQTKERMAMLESPAFIHQFRNIG